ncbi:MAG: nucleotidyltransferase family protein [Gammaproteobacteria bacterium]
MLSAMILAAGRGRRLAPITDKTPKPLLEVGGKTLIDHHLDALIEAGITHVVVNVAHLSDQIVKHLRSVNPGSIEVVISEEPPDALETGGGILQALDKIKSDPFLVLNGDVLTDLDLSSVPDQIEDLAHLILVANPVHHPRGDFVLDGDRLRALADKKDQATLTYAGIGVYRKAFFSGCAPGRFGLGPLLKKAAREDRLSGSLYEGRWIDIGTPERLKAARATGHR